MSVLRRRDSRPSSFVASASADLVKAVPAPPEEPEEVLEPANCDLLSAEVCASLEEELLKEPREAEDASGKMVAHPERLNGAIALIAGGTIGAGIIALPVKTVAAGFIPSTVALTACW